MSDSDAEFEKFLQQSLSSSGASYISEFSRSRRSKSGERSPSPTHQPWWMRGDPIKVAESDNELEATAHSWLKSTAQSQKAGQDSMWPAANLQITLPSSAINDYSKDSLEESKSLSATLTNKSHASKSEESYSYSTDKSSSISDSHSAPFTSTQPGLDTLEENAEKRRFFDELEHGRDTPLDYSQLNRELGETGKSSLLDTLSPTFDYEDDFDSETPHEDGSTSSSHSPTPTASLKDFNTAKKEAAITKTSEDHKALLSSSAIEDKPPAQAGTLLTRNSIKQSLLHRDSAPPLTTGLPLTENNEFKLSPIHPATVPQTAVGLANKSFESHTNSSILSSDSNSSVSQAKADVILTPLLAKQLTASSDVFNNSSAERGKSTSEGKQQVQSAVTTLSPLHAAGAVVRPSKSELQSPEKKASATDERLQTFGLSPVDTDITKSSSNHGRQLKVHNEIDRSSPVHKQQLHYTGGTNSMLLQQKGEKIISSWPQTTGDSPVAKENLKPLPGQTLTTVDDSLETHTKEKCEAKGFVVTTAEQMEGDQDGLSCDLAELQSALQAAGLPPMEMKEETHREEEEGGSLESPLKEYPSVDASGEDVKDSSSPPVRDYVGKEPVHVPPASFSGENSEQETRQSMPAKQTDRGVLGMDLREAIRAIASEELTTISRKILRQGVEQQHGSDSQQQCLHLEKDTPSVSAHPRQAQSDKKLNQGCGLDGNKRQQASSDERLEVLGDILDDIERAEGDKISTKSVKKQGVGGTRKSVATLPKMTSKSLPSKKALTSKVDTSLRPSSKLRAVAPVSSQPVVTKKSSLKDKSSSRLTTPSNVNRAPSAATAGSRTKLSTQSQMFRRSTSSKSAPPKQLGNGCTTLKQVSKSAVKSSQQSKREIVIPTGSSTVLESDVSDSEDDVIQAGCEGGKKTTDGGPDIKVDTRKKALQEGKEISESLSLQLNEKEKEFLEKERQLKEAHHHKVNQLRQEIFTLSVKLKDAESAKDPRQLLAQGRGAEVNITEEEKSTLEKNIKEQEVLLQGYQKENERLYAELSRRQKESKAEQSQLFKENQRLASELLNIKAQLDRQILSSAPRTESSPSESTHPDSARVSHLEDQLDRANSTSKDLQKQIKQLKHSNQSFEKEAKVARQQVRQLEDKLRVMVDREQLQQIRSQHQEEVSSLTQKLEWYAENQQLLDRDCELLHSKEEEIVSLKEKLASLEGEGKQRSVRSRATEARRVQQLEQQVREMENIIKKRFPNSLSALILSSGVAEGQSKTSATQLGVATTKSAPPTRAFLEKRVHQLESVLENKDKECARKLRALHQKYSALEVNYEKQIASLKEQVASLTPADDSKKLCQEFEREVKQVKLELEKTQRENHQLKEVIRSGQGEVGVSERQSTTDRDNVPSQDFRSSLVADSIRAENEQLKEKLSELNFEMAHQRVQLQGKMAETESRAALMKETMQEKIQKMEKDHRTQLDSLLAKFAKEHSKSETTRLQSQLATREATIAHLRKKLECAEFDIKKLSAGQEREGRLKDQVKVLTEQLLEAKRHHTPEMYHFMALQTKIATLEHKCNEYELAAKQQLHVLSQPLAETVEERIKEVEQKWKKQLLEKNSEIEHYREELDSLLSAMQVVKQGV